MTAQLPEGIIRIEPSKWSDSSFRKAIPTTFFDRDWK